MAAVMTKWSRIGLLLSSVMLAMVNGETQPEISGSTEVVPSPQPAPSPHSTDIDANQALSEPSNSKLAALGEKVAESVDSSSADEEISPEEKRRFDSISDSGAFSSFGKRKFDPIGSSAFRSFGKRKFDPIGNSAFTSFGKRTFDPIGKSSFTSFGKRTFDPIGKSSFTSFGKRTFDPIGKSSFTSFGKRRFDPIGKSSFTSFGKRRFDPIGKSSFTSFGKRRFDPIGNSGFTSFGKRAFDPIGNSAFTSFGKRAFDPIGNSAFTSFGKRAFDPIGNSAFTSFGKRTFDPIGNSGFTSFGKRTFDPIGNSGFTSFGKRTFDPIGNSGFTSFGKKASDLSYSDPSSVSQLSDEEPPKRAFDRISTSQFSSFGKKSMDSIASSGFAGFKRSSLLPTSSNAAFDDVSDEKRSFDSIAHSGFRSFGKRQDEAVISRKKRDVDDISKRVFDSIEYKSKFRRFGARRSKRDTDNVGEFLDFPVSRKRAFDSISGGTFGTFGKRESDSIPLDFVKRLLTSKRHFDPISAGSYSGFGKRVVDRIGNSAFRTFGKRHLDKKRRFDSISSSAYTGFGKRIVDKIGNSAFRTFGKRHQFDPVSSGDSDAVDKVIADQMEALISKASKAGELGKKQTKDLPDSSLLESLGLEEDLDDELLEMLLTLPDLSREDSVAQTVKAETIPSANLIPTPKGTVAKRIFDSIDNRSAFRRFGRYRPATRFALTPYRSTDFHSLNNSANLGTSSNADLLKVLTELSAYIRSLNLEDVDS